jgi:acyl carrier protein
METGMISRKHALALIANALNVPQVTEDSRAEDLPDWDSLGHLGILTALDSATGGKAASIDDLAQATSVREILDALGKASLLSD